MSSFDFIWGRIGLTGTLRVNTAVVEYEITCRGVRVIVVCVSSSWQEGCVGLTIVAEGFVTVSGFKNVVPVVVVVIVWSKIISA
jgi:hypothetical protein